MIGGEIELSHPQMTAPLRELPDDPALARWIAFIPAALLRQQPENDFPPVWIDGLGEDAFKAEDIDLAKLARGHDVALQLLRSQRTAEAMDAALKNFFEGFDRLT